MLASLVVLKTPSSASLHSVLHSSSCLKKARETQAPTGLLKGFLELFCFVEGGV